jgi:hypothetical protein
MPTTVDGVFSLSIAVYFPIEHLVPYPSLNPRYLYQTTGANSLRNLQSFPLILSYLVGNLSSSDRPCVFEKSLDASYRLARPTAIDWHLP